MRKGLYAKLAVSNLKKNRIFYLPYLLACIGTVMMFDVMLTLCLDPALKNMSGGADVMLCLSLGSVVTAIFSVIILYYTSSVLVKHRKKEFGLYNMLGMEKRHIGLVLLWEMLYTAVISLVVGLLSSVVISKLLQLILMRILDCDVHFALSLDPYAALVTVALFAGIYLLLYLRSLLIVRHANPVELLRGSSEGEKEPKSNWLLAVLGVICLAIGYVISLKTSSAVYALLMFFVAVLFVIAGTYLLFTSFSIVLLKALRKNKKYYYRTSHFATVSGMIYRMKRNAAGLASICILSTMVLVTVSTTLCLYAGVEEITDARYPSDVSVFYNRAIPEELRGEMIDKVQTTVAGQNRTTSKFAAYTQLNFSAQRTGTEDTLSVQKNGEEILSTKQKEVLQVLVITAEGYESLTGKAVTLAPGEALCWSEGKPFGDTLEMMGETYRLTQLDSFPFSSGFLVMGVNTVYLVVDGEDTLQCICEAQAKIFEEYSSLISYTIRFNVDGTDQEKVACSDAVAEAIKGTVGADGTKYTCSVQNRQTGMKDFYSFYGSFFFLGMFLGLLFMCATVLIIYYKQISEGYDDRERFSIMQKVGMTTAEVKSTIHTQVLIVFFLPILAAAIHVAFAFPMVRSILSAFGMINSTLFMCVTLITLAIFALLYTLVYLATARAYYKIVSGKAEG